MPSAAFITTDYSLTEPREPNGCAFYRCDLPAHELANLGWDVALGMPIAHPDYGIGMAVEGGGLFGFNIAVFKLLMQAQTVPMIQVMQKRDVRVVIDIDDFHFRVPDDNIAYSITDPSKNLDSNRMHYEESLRYADRLTVSTDFLANFYERRCRDVVVVRNAIDSVRYEMVEQPEIPVLGWVGATPWRGGDIALLSQWLPQFTDEHRLRFHHSGHMPNDPRPLGVRLNMRRVSTSMMVPMSRYPSLLTHFHIGLVPLIESDFNESKSYLKGLEYAAAGIPFIASPSSEYRLLHEAGVGRLAATPDEWRDHATELLDVDVRIAEAARQRKIVEEQFDISTMGEAWASALSG